MSKLGWSKRIKIILAMVAAISLLGGSEVIFTQTPAAGLQTGSLKQRSVRRKPARTLLDAGLRPDVVVVKFREGTRVRERLGQAEANLTGLPAPEEQQLQRAGLSRQQLFQDLAQVNNLVAPNSRRYLKKLFARSEQELDDEKRAGETRTGEELADLNLYHYILIENANPRETERLLDQLNAMDSVEIAYAQPIATGAQVDFAPTTPNLSAQQGYVNAAAGPGSSTNGIDAAYARLFPGGRGTDVNIIDIEQGWNLTHEDMPPVFFAAGPNRGDSEPRQHGTSVLGVLAAAENGYGVTGIVPQSRIGISSALSRTCIVPGLCWWTDDIENSINRSAAALRWGDILIIEQHAPGPDSGGVAACNASQFEFVAMEFWDANFDAIRNATAKGIIVVEAAGNGSMDLDSPIYDGKFDRTVRDSGAILVGGGTSAGRAPKCWTNFGSRVDLQGWGENVTTLGGGGERFNGTDDTQWYTHTFSGTSSATPIVAGAAAALQGFRKQRGLSPFSSQQMRDFLRTTGMAQAADPRQIGPLPNLRAAIDAHAPKRNLKVTFLSIKVVDGYFAGPHALSFNFTVNNKAGSYSATYPQNTAVNLPASLNFTVPEILNDGLTIFVNTNLRSIIKFHPKTGAVISVESRPVHVIRFFPTGTSFSSSPFSIFGSKVFTDRSTNATGYFDVTYRVEQVLDLATFAP